MLKIIKNKLEQGCKTSKYPREPISLYQRYRGMPIIDKNCSEDIARQCAAICPQDCIDISEKTIDLGRCTFCGHCEAVGKGAFIRFSQNFELGAADRKVLVTDGTLPDLAEHSKQH
jgi:formate hydrogenlyase subunit 6/NADH:ubiquinone oxidoreductase subunit I